MGNALSSCIENCSLDWNVHKLQGPRASRVWKWAFQREWGENWYYFHKITPSNTNNKEIWPQRQRSSSAEHGQILQQRWRLYSWRLPSSNPLGNEESKLTQERRCRENPFRIFEDKMRFDNRCRIRNRDGEIWWRLDHYQLPSRSDWESMEIPHRSQTSRKDLCFQIL